MEITRKWILIPSLNYTDVQNKIIMEAHSQNTKKKILISGAGVAGIVSALLLDPKKYEIEIIERADSFRNIGFSVLLWRSGFVLLEKLLAQKGISLNENRDYYPVNHLAIFGGVKITKVKQYPSKGYAWIMERERLMEILEKALFKEAEPRQIRFSTFIEELKEDDSGVKIRFNDGTEKQYDFMIVAEGINSSTRKLLFPTKERVVPLGQTLRYVWFDKATDLEDRGALFFTQNHLGVIHPPYTRNLLGYYFKDGTSIVQQKEFEEKVLGVIKQTNGQRASFDPETSKVFSLKNIYLPEYHSKRAVLVGDAAHGRPPTTGFGTSLAIEDAAVICGILNSVDYFKNIAPILKEFSRIRSKRVEKIYRFQNLIHMFITSSAWKVRFLTLCFRLFYAKYMEYKVKKFASYSLKYPI